MDDCFESKVQFSGRYGDLGELCFLDELLDMMGLPEDNGDADYCNYANAHDGLWPKWGFCRDSWYHNFTDMTPEDFVSDTLECISKITDEERVMYDTAHLMSHEEKSDPKNFEKW
jgi:hypothetical protein